MKPLLARLVQDQRDSFRRISVAREYLQSRVLLSLQDAGAFARWAFLGGTALRFLFDLVWYLSDPAWPPPNVSFLRNALAQSGWSGPLVDESTWRSVIRSALDAPEATRSDSAP